MFNLMLRKTRRMKLDSLVFMLLLSACTATTPRTEQAQAQNAWDNRVATPGAKLFFEEDARDRNETGSAVIYKLRTEGLPKEKTYSLWHKFINGHIAESR